MSLRTLGTVIVLAAAASACRSVGTSSEAKPDNTTSPSMLGANTTTTGAHRTVGTEPGHVGDGTPLTAAPGNELAAFAGGCFWGTEDVFRQVPGVVATAVGYTGGKTTHPTYETVCSHTTAHAETVLIEFDPKVINYEQLVTVFMQNHNPTTMNRQGPDVGDQYRSEVFTFSDAQAETTKKVIAEIQKTTDEKIVTKIEPIPAFWKAEDYHQQYDEKTGTHSCPMPKGLPPKGA